RGLGVEVRLEAGERVRFAPLRAEPPVYELPPPEAGAEGADAPFPAPQIPPPVGGQGGTS
ncbi:MAG TPA: hypothetical protein VJP77_00455, partial [Planctomycetota bacterium]|nr:hypothetical protein [Planctomycetota bacterium]